MTIKPPRPVSEDARAFGRKLEDARRGMGLSQRALGQKLKETGIKGRWSVSPIENGTVHLTKEEAEAIYVTVQGLEWADIQPFVQEVKPTPTGATQAPDLIWVVDHPDGSIYFKTEIDALRYVAGDAVRSATLRSPT